MPDAAATTGSIPDASDSPRWCQFWSRPFLLVVAGGWVVLFAGLVSWLPLAPERRIDGLGKLHLEGFVGDGTLVASRQTDPGEEPVVCVDLPTGAVRVLKTASKEERDRAISPSEAPREGEPVAWEVEQVVTVGEAVAASLWGPDGGVVVVWNAPTGEELLRRNNSLWELERRGGWLSIKELGEPEPRSHVLFDPRTGREVRIPPPWDRWGAVATRGVHAPSDSLPAASSSRLVWDRDITALEPAVVRIVDPMTGKEVVAEGVNFAISSDSRWLAAVTVSTISPATGLLVTASPWNAKDDRLIGTWRIYDLATGEVVVETSEPMNFQGTHIEFADQDRSLVRYGDRRVTILCDGPQFSNVGVWDWQADLARRRGEPEKEPFESTDNVPAPAALASAGQIGTDRIEEATGSSIAFRPRKSRCGLFALVERRNVGSEPALRHLLDGDALVDIITGTRLGSFPPESAVVRLASTGQWATAVRGRTLSSALRKLVSQFSGWLATLFPSEEDQVLYDVSRGRSVASLPRGGERTFSPDGNWFVLSRTDGTLEVWRLPPALPWGRALAISLAVPALFAAARLWRRRRATPATATSSSIAATAAPPWHGATLSRSTEEINES